MKKLFLILSTFLSLSLPAFAFEAKDAIHGIVHINQKWGMSNGIILNDEGLILSLAFYNLINHQEDDISICLYTDTISGECSLKGKLVTYDNFLHLALIQAEFEDGKTFKDFGESPLEFSSEPVNIDEKVFLIDLNKSGPLLLITPPTIDFELRSIIGRSYLTDNILWFYNIAGPIDPSNEGVVFNEDGKIVGFSEFLDENEAFGGGPVVDVRWFGNIISSQTILLWLNELARLGEIGNEFILDEYKNLYLYGFEGVYNVKLFNDVDISTYNAMSIAYLKSNEIMKGYEDGSFKPDFPINRAELLKILVEGAGENPSEDYKDCFPDVGAEWYAKYVCFAKEKGWIDGYPDGTFKPEKNINKAEALKMLMEIFRDHINLLDASKYLEYCFYTDVAGNEWYADYVLTGKRYGIIDYSKYPYQYYPSEDITRAEIGDNLYRVLMYHIPYDILE